MTNRRTVIGLILLGVVLGAGTVFAFSSFGTTFRTPPQPPTIAGQSAPEAAFTIDFSKRYDLHCSHAGHPTILRRCKILGFTGRSNPSPSLAVAVPFSVSSGPYFESWLVLELSDGRLAYLPPHCLDFIEEAASRSG